MAHQQTWDPDRYARFVADLGAPVVDLLAGLEKYRSASATTLGALKQAKPGDVELHR